MRSLCRAWGAGPRPDRNAREAKPDVPTGDYTVAGDNKQCRLER